MPSLGALVFGSSVSNFCISGDEDSYFGGGLKAEVYIERIFWDKWMYSV